MNEFQIPHGSCYLGLHPRTRPVHKFTYPFLSPRSGLRAFKKKNEEDLSFFTSVQKGGKGKGARQQEKAAAAPTASDPKKRVNHTIETLSSFMALNLDVPQTIAEMTSAVEKVCYSRERQAPLISPL